MSTERIVTERWELAASEAREALHNQLVVAFLGSASSGKDAAIKALFGIDFGEIDPIPGSTDRLRVAPIDSLGQVLVVNAPGFGDLRDEVDAEAQRALGSLDLAVYLLNADGGATIDEKRDLDRIRALGRPVLVCINKIDLLRPAQRDEFVHATLAQLEVDPNDAVLTAFDPLPALSPEPIGVDETIAWISRTLREQGKDLLFAKNLRNKARACEPLIAAAAKKAAVAGAIPVPGADATAVTVVQIRLIADIAAVFGREIDRDVVLFMLGEALAGGTKGFVRWAVNALKSAGWVPGGQAVHVATSTLGATISAAATWGVGKAAVAYMQRGDLTPEQFRDVFETATAAYRARRESTPETPRG